VRREISREGAPRWLTLVAGVIAAIIIALNVKLLWDIAAGFVLMQEAGGMVTGLDKKDPTRGSFVAANTSLAPKITELVEGRLKKPGAGSKLLKPL